MSTANLISIGKIQRGDKPDGDTKIDIRKGTPLGLRFDTGDPFEDNCSFDEWLEDVVREYTDEAALEALEHIGQHVINGTPVTLVCDCDPQQSYHICHGHTVSRYVREAVAAYYNS